MINLNIEGKSYRFNKGIILREILAEVDVYAKNRIVAAVVNNKLRDLNKDICREAEIKFLRRESVLGNRIYRRSLFMVLAKAVYELFPGSVLSIEHSLSNGTYCELYKSPHLDQSTLMTIESKMKEIVSDDILFKYLDVSIEKAIEIFKKQGFQDKVELLEQMDAETVTLYELDNYYDYFYYKMVPATSYLDKFRLHFNYPGFILLFPHKDNPEIVPEFKNQPKLANVFMEYEKLGDILEVGYAHELNNHIKERNYSKIITLAEALHEKNIARIADDINDHINTKKIILIAGPSSSGKTTFLQRLSTQLKLNGLKPAGISLDDYFVNRENTPRDEDGNYDFETIAAIDLKLLNIHLIKLLDGKKIEVPSFNFKKGKREYRGRELKLERDQILLIEGIHGLNEGLTRDIPRDLKYKIYVSALTQINIDRHNRIPTTDTRILRRIIRDHKYRNHSASQTIEIWPQVRRGEEKYIFPFQENADIMFNSALIYELPVLKKYVMPLLQKIDRNQPSYYEARRLLELLDCFRSMPDDDIPKTSILKEFIGGSIFREHT